MRRNKFKKMITAFLVIALTLGMFTSNVTNTYAKTTQASVSITIDGNANDWRDIKNSLDDPSGRFDRVAAFCDADYFYCIFVTNDRSDWCYHECFIDTDNNLNTGFEGYEFMQENENLYISEGGEWPDTEIEDGCETALSEDNQTVEIKVPLKILKPKGKTVNFTLVLLNDNWESVHHYPGELKTKTAPLLKDAQIVSKQPYISDFKLTTGNVKALTKATIKGHTIGKFSAKGGDGKKYAYSLVASEANGPDNNHFKLKDNKLITNDKLLEPGKYTILVKVKSGVRSEIKKFKIKVGAPNASSITEDYFVGEPGDWFTVPYTKTIRKAAKGNKFVLRSTKSQDKLYLMLESTAKDLDTRTVFALDTIKNSGYNYFGMPGVDYILKEGNLYKLTGNDSAPALKKAVDTSFAKDYTSVRVPLKALGNPKNIKVCAFANNKETIIPKTGSLSVSKSFKMHYDKGFVYPTEYINNIAAPFKGFAARKANLKNGLVSAYDYSLIYDLSKKVVTDVKGNKVKTIGKKGSGSSPAALLSNDNINNTINTVINKKISWIGSGSACLLSEGDFEADFYEGNVNYLNRIMGYNLSVKKITKIKEVKPSSKIKFTVELRNKGVAAFPAKYSVQVALINSKGKVVAKASAGDVSTIRASKTGSFDMTLATPKTLAKGSYTVAVSIIDKKGNPCAALSNKDVNNDLRYEMYVIK